MLPATGKISASMFNNELGRNTTAKITMNDNELRELAEIPAANSRIRFSDLHGKTVEIIKTYNPANHPNGQIYISSYFTDSEWRSETSKRLVIEVSQEMRAVNGTNALDIKASNQPNWGGLLTLENNGIITGLAGASNSVGGTAINVNSRGDKNQVINIINTGIIRAGGGGGGQGGKGGASYRKEFQREPQSGFREDIWAKVQDQQGPEFGYRWSRRNNIGYYYWNGVIVASINWWADPPPAIAGNDGWWYTVGRWINYYDNSFDRWDTWALARERTIDISVEGGTGGAGGRGAGSIDRSNTAGFANGANGANGAVSGSSTGGRGGRGGDGGNFGAQGNTGAVGEQGIWYIAREIREPATGWLYDENHRWSIPNANVLWAGAVVYFGSIGGLTSVHNGDWEYLRGPQQLLGYRIARRRFVQDRYTTNGSTGNIGGLGGFAINASSRSEYVLDNRGTITGRLP